MQSCILKNGFYDRKQYSHITVNRFVVFFFLKLSKCCGYSLEVSQCDTSSENHNKCFDAEIIKYCHLWVSCKKASFL